ncbi:MAG: metallophosphoesterase family protein [Pirellulales bacterium]
MRILLLADIHANWPAMSSIDEKFDACICLGDLVDYGPAPSPCIEWVKDHAQYTIRGNHDHGVAQRILSQGQSGYRYLTRVTRQLMWELLGEAELRWLGRLPVVQSVDLDGLRLYLVHGTPRDPLDEYLLPDAEQWTQRLAVVEADIVCVGHTHVPFVLEVDGKTVVNPGSVGQPRDGDPRCSYAVIEDGRVELRRCDYPVEDTVRLLEDSSIPDDAKQFAAQALRTGGRDADRIAEEIGS